MSNLNIIPQTGRFGDAVDAINANFTLLDEQMSHFYSAYDVWIEAGNTGTIDDFLQSLTAYGIAVENGYTGTQQQWLASLKGADGLDGVVLDPEAMTIFDDPSDLEGKTDEEKARMIPNGVAYEQSGGAFATGEDVGNVSIFDDPSDLTGKTDAQKALMVPNARVLLFYDESSTKEIPSANWIRGTVKGAFGAVYNAYGSWDYMYFIPIEFSSKVIITAAAYRALIGFVTNTTQSNGSTVPYAEGETGSHIIAANATQVFDVPSNAKYIVCAQKIGENCAYPSKVVCIYNADAKIKELKDYTDTELAEKQNVRYGVDLSSQNIIPSRDDINSNNNNQRATLRMMPVYKGDVINVAKVNGVGTGTMLVRTFNKGETQTAQTGWISTYTIQQDGYVTIVVNSGVTSGGTAQFLLDALSMHRYIETIAKIYLEEKWGNDNDKIVYDNILQNDGKKYYPFEGVSPFANTLTWKSFLPKNAASNQSMAIYNGLIFKFGKGASVAIWDYYNKYRVGSINAIMATNVFECNSSWFSNEFYDPADEFPILYSEAIYTSPAVCGFRIQRVNGVWSITKVHEIYRDGETGGAIVFLDKQNDRLIYYINHNFISYQRPKYADSVDGVSTLYETDIISTIENQGWQSMNFGQDKTCVGHMAVGISNAIGGDNNKIIGINLNTGEIIFKFLPPSPWGEGEGCEWYCGRLYCSDAQGNFFELTFP